VALPRAHWVVPVVPLPPEPSDHTADHPADDPADRPVQLTVHVLRVTLLDVHPPIWRELRVPSVVGLPVLHAVIQIAMGWEDRHLHEWRVGDLLYLPSDEEDWGEDGLDEASVTLVDVGPLDSAFQYIYDMGDNWEHLVEVLAIDRYDASLLPLACLGGERAAPPEDVGGPFGYEHLLDALADPDDAEHDEVVETYRDSWSPGDFDPGRVNERLEELWRAV
jgi:hypothetical protein